MITTDQIVEILTQKGFGIISTERNVNVKPYRTKTFVCTLSTRKIANSELFDPFQVSLCCKFQVFDDANEAHEIYSGYDITTAIEIYNSIQMN